jgi:hypothetical protein
METTIVTKNYEGQETGKASIYELIRGITLEQLAYFLGEYLNVGMKDGFRTGKSIGKYCQSDHRTIQGELIRFFLGAIIELSNQEYTDPRNAMPVEMGKKIKALVDDGTLKMGWMI